jgi:hypothetical protein
LRRSNPTARLAFQALRGLPGAADDPPERSVNIPRPPDLKPETGNHPDGAFFGPVNHRARSPASGSRRSRAEARPAADRRSGRDCNSRVRIRKQDHPRTWHGPCPRQRCGSPPRPPSGAVTGHLRRACFPQEQQPMLDWSLTNVAPGKDADDWGKSDSVLGGSALKVAESSEVGMKSAARLAAGRRG